MMMALRGLVMLSGLLAGSASLVLTAGEWQDLFDGETLDGWAFDVLDDSDPTAIYSARDGVLHVAGKDRANAVLRTAATYDRYDLKFEWRWPDEPGNSGCLVHCSTPRLMNVWPRSIEVQVQSGNAGDLIHIGETIAVPVAQIPTDLSGRNQWKVRLRHNLTDDSERPAGEWNRMHVKVRPTAITVWVNGILVNHGTDPSVTSGAICLQAERANVQYRHIRLKPHPR